MSTKEKTKQNRLLSFIVFNLVEEIIIAVIAFILIQSLAPYFLVPGMVIVAIGLLLFTLVKIYTYRSSADLPVYEPLIGQAGVALTDFVEEQPGIWQGKVRVRGETWKAQSEESIPNNQMIWVLDLEGLTLRVTKSQNS
jgi:membrane-bound ClpP family serine protease